ncbi:MAG: glycine cleavage system aminomethyltransferase GcvT [Candidatus Promineifilaceae bacterium]
MTVDFIFRGSAADLDPHLQAVVDQEDIRQKEKIILVASESMAPIAVRELMASSFGNVYAEGYPRAASRKLSETAILDLDAELAHYRRYSDPRYYKGVEYADVIEALARRRAADLFSANNVSPEELYINVQPLSGSPANIAAYSAMLEPGDKIMGLDLKHGGHLTHGSKVSRSGKLYEAIPYTVNQETERLDYEAIESLAMEHRPKLIVAGFTAYPLSVDWARFREISDRCGAYLMADIAHISGLVAAGLHPSPIGIADVVTTTTHKSLCGPRGAMIMTHRKDLVRKIDRAVFPGEQGGPHLNTIAALALALKLANTDQFRDLQLRVMANASRLAKKLSQHGLRVVTGGTENHLLLVDVKSISHGNNYLSGDMAARILDVAGIVTNSNTIPGDRTAFSASGIRMGTVWISQLGFADQEVDMLAEAIATVLQGCTPFTYARSGNREFLRSKIEPDALQLGRSVVSRLKGTSLFTPIGDTVEIRGEGAFSFLNHALANDVEGLDINQVQAAHVIGPDFEEYGSLYRIAEDRYRLRLQDDQRAALVTQWFSDLSDGYVRFDDLHAKLEGPVVVKNISSDGTILLPDTTPSPMSEIKPYFVGCRSRSAIGNALPEFIWNDAEDAPLKKTNLHKTHVELGGRMVPFGGWDMPVWYSSVSEEHSAVRQSAGLFDVSHMGVLEVSGPHAGSFLNTVTTNDLSGLGIGKSHYTYLLFPDGSVVDDLLVYRRGSDRYMLVVNASNNDKDWAWLTAVNEGRIQIDNERPGTKIQHQAELRDLRDLRWGDDCLVDIALQGPCATDILLSVCDDGDLASRIAGLPWAGLTEGGLAGIPAVVSRTGYTGERIAYEIFVHPNYTPDFWNILMEVGEPFDLKPCGLAARDSTRTEAGLPLYGHELAGPLEMNPADAAFASYVKLWKPFFIGRRAYIDYESRRDRIVVRFQMEEKGVRRPELLDPVLDRRGKVVGSVTSCAIGESGYLLGQAVVPVNMSESGTSLAIYQLGGGKRKLRVPDIAKYGARMPVPDRATVLSRFPLR